MKKFIEKVKDVWGIEELRNRILLTLGLILVYRLGTFIVLPGINPNALNQNQNQEGLLGLINMFAGGAFSNGAILALGVMPYISASIFMQLAGIVIPQFAKLQKEESGRNKINQYTRLLTIVVAAFQGSAYIGTYLRPIPGAIVMDNMLFYVSTVILLTAGTLFVMWLGEKITDKGIGNGVSLLIMVGILGRFPQAVAQEFTTKIGQDKILFLLIELAMFIAVLIGLVMLTQGVRKIPLNYARRIVGTNAAKEIGGARNFIPLKVNSAGVMPIIFAQALLFIPAMIAGLVSKDGNAAGWLKSLSDHTTMSYNLVYAVLVIVFTYFYTALIFNPTEMAENLKRNNSFIPGIQPGQPTADYIGAIMDRITLPGAVFLALAGILPGIAALLGVTSGFSTFFGGTSMLIGVAVILDTIQQIDSYLLMRQYDGMMKTGRVSGRQAVQL